jgi:hypothetical protein
MAFKLDGNPLAVDVPFTYGDVHYPANWLRLSTADEKTALGITEVADDPVYDNRFYWSDGTPGSLLARYDWYVVRKAEKSTAIPSAITTYRDAVRTACDTREKEIDACSDTAALVTLYGSTEQSDKTFKPNMTQYPVDPNE